MEYKEALDKAKEFSKFIGKQLHIEEFKEKITIKKVYLCEQVSSKNEPGTKPQINSFENLDLNKDHSEKMKGLNLDVIIVYEKAMIIEDIASDFNEKYPLL